MRRLAKLIFSLTTCWIILSLSWISTSSATLSRDSQALDHQLKGHFEFLERNREESLGLLAQMEKEEAELMTGKDLLDRVHKEEDFYRQLSERVTPIQSSEKLSVVLSILLRTEEHADQIAQWREFVELWRGLEEEVAVVKASNEGMGVIIKSAGEKKAQVREEVVTGSDISRVVESVILTHEKTIRESLDRRANITLAMKALIDRLPIKGEALTKLHESFDRWSGDYFSDRGGAPEAQASGDFLKHAYTLLHLETLKDLSALREDQRSLEYDLGNHRGKFKSLGGPEIASENAQYEEQLGALFRTQMNGALRKVGLTTGLDSGWTEKDTLDLLDGAVDADPACGDSRGAAPSAQTDAFFKKMNGILAPLLGEFNHEKAKLVTALEEGPEGDLFVHMIFSRAEEKKIIGQNLPPYQIRLRVPLREYWNIYHKGKEGREIKKSVSESFVGLFQREKSPENRLRLWFPNSDEGEQAPERSSMCFTVDNGVQTSLCFAGVHDEKGEEFEWGTRKTTFRPGTDTSSLSVPLFREAGTTSLNEHQYKKLIYLWRAKELLKGQIAKSPFTGDEEKGRPLREQAHGILAQVFKEQLRTEIP